MFSRGFSGKFENFFPTEQLQTATSELKKEGVNIGHQWLESGITSEKAKFRFFKNKKGVSFGFKFLLEPPFRYLFWGIFV